MIENSSIPPEILKLSLASASKKTTESKKYFDFFADFAQIQQYVNNWTESFQTKNEFLCSFIQSRPINTKKIWLSSRIERSNDLKLISRSLGDTEEKLNDYVATSIAYLIEHNYLEPLQLLHENNLTLPSIKSTELSNFFSIDFIIFYKLPQSNKKLSEDTAFRYCVDNEILSVFDFQTEPENEEWDLIRKIRSMNLNHLIANLLTTYNQSLNNKSTKEAIIYPKILYLIEKNTSPLNYPLVLAQVIKAGTGWHQQDKQIASTLERYLIQEKMAVAATINSAPAKIHKI